MPPKAKFTKEEIVSAALGIVRADGFSALTARALGTKLASSARPIFTVFKSMEEVQQEVIKAAKACYKKYVQTGLAQVPAFKGVGMQYIEFASKEAKLFQLLFMTEQTGVMTEQTGSPDVKEVLPLIEENYTQIRSALQQAYALDDTETDRLYRHLWVYTHGLAVLCATKMCSFSKVTISEMLTEIFTGQLKEIKAGR